MRIGFTIEKRSKEKLLLTCDEVVYIPWKDQTSTTFFEFVKAQTGQIVFLDIAEIGLQLVQMLPALEWLAEQGRYFVFLDKDYFSELNNERYHQLLLHLARIEKTTIKNRTQFGLDKAVENGTQLGRPQTSPETIATIRELYTTQKRTIREIADICEVSLGTAYKYAMGK